MKKFRKFLCLSVFSIISSPLWANTVVFVPDREELTVTDWFYREIASAYLPGCYLPNYLHGGPWYPKMFQTNYAPKKTPEGYQVDLKQSLSAKICAAKMDAYNIVSIQLRDSESPVGYWLGAFNVHPDGTERETTVKCYIDSSQNPVDALICDAAHVNMNGKGTVYIFLELSHDNW